MKLDCMVVVVNRLHLNLNVKSQSKYLKSTLAVGKEPKKENDYFLIHFSTVNKSGTKYNIIKIKQVFVKCLNDGKATLRFEDPPHDLCIKANELELKNFIKLLRSCITGDTKTLKLLNLSSLSTVSKDPVPTKLYIKDRSEFPCKGLPRSLEFLYINGIKMCNFRREILSLNQLTVLDLSDNEIEKIPPEFGRLPNLNELYLANNNLGLKKEVDWRWLAGPKICVKLRLLDLSGNNIKEIPKTIWKLQNLVSLKMNKNLLTRLPASLGRINTLRYLTISQNQLQTLPYGLMQCGLEYVDLSCNNTNVEKTSGVQEPQSPWEMYITSLVHVTGKSVLKHKLLYGPGVIPKTLVEFLDNASICMCGKPVLSDRHYIIKEYELKDFFRTVVYNNNSSTFKFECCFCSKKCYTSK